MILLYWLYYISLNHIDMRILIELFIAVISYQKYDSNGTPAPVGM